MANKKPVRVEGASFNKEHWLTFPREKFMEMNKDVYGKRFKGREDAEQITQALLTEAADQIYGSKESAELAKGKGKQ